MAALMEGTSTKCYAVPGSNMFIICYIGDIRDATTKGVVTGEYGGRPSQVTEALIDSLGHNYYRKRLDVLEKRHFNLDSVYSVRTGWHKGSSIEYVFHAPVHGFPRFPYPELWMRNMSSVYKKVWETADQNGIDALTLPILGSGTAEAPLGLAIKALVESLFQCHTRTLKEIRIVSMYEDVHRNVKELCDQYVKKSYLKTDHQGKYERATSDHIHTERGKKSYPKTNHQGMHERATSDHIHTERGKKEDNFHPFETTYQSSFTDKTWSNGRNRYHGRSDFSSYTPHSTISSSDTGRNLRNPQMINDALNVSLAGTGMAVTENTIATKTSLDGNATTSLHRNATTSLHGNATTPLHGNATSTKTSTMSTSKRADADAKQCPICMDVIKKVHKLSKCGHEFCEKCISDSFKQHKPACPICNTIYGVVTGNQPDGRMSIERSREDLPGYPGCGTIIITYTFYSGVQKSEHPHPGEDYYGTKRIAFLPDNTEGQMVRRLLQIAFDRRLTFTIGRSSMTGMDDVVTWNDIHHKTSMHGGKHSFGYPDSTYLSRVQEELASKGITEESLQG